MRLRSRILLSGFWNTLKYTGEPFPGQRSVEIFWQTDYKLEIVSIQRHDEIFFDQPAYPARGESS